MTPTVNLSVVYVINVFFTISSYSFLIAVLMGSSGNIRQVFLRAVGGASLLALMFTGGGWDIWNPGDAIAMLLYAFFLVLLGIVCVKPEVVVDAKLYYVFVLIGAYTLSVSRIMVADADSREVILSLMQLNGGDLAAVFLGVLFLTIVLRLVLKKIVVVNALVVIYLAGVILDIPAIAIKNIFQIDPDPQIYYSLLFLISLIVIFLVSKVLRRAVFSSSGSIQ